MSVPNPQKSNQYFSGMTNLFCVVGLKRGFSHGLSAENRADQITIYKYETIFATRGLTHGWVSCPTELANLRNLQNIGKQINHSIASLVTHYSHSFGTLVPDGGAF